MDDVTVESSMAVERDYLVTSSTTAVLLLRLSAESEEEKTCRVYFRTNEERKDE